MCMCLTALLSSGIHKKANLWEMKVNDTKTRKVHVNGNKFCTRKNGDHKPSGLGGRLLITVVIRQAGKQ